MSAPSDPLPVRVVGIGASAGGLEAITGTLRVFPPETAAAFVVVQHLSPDHPSLMRELLDRRIGMPVVDARDGIELEEGVCYLMPPGSEIRLDASVLRVTMGEPGERHTFPVDSFLSSLAAERGQDAMAVVLSGTGSDGTAGCAEVHGAGGLVIAQSPESAAFDGMPRAVIERGIASAVLRPEAIAEAVLERVGVRLASDASSDLDAELRPVLAAVQRAAGIDLSGYRQSALWRRIQRFIGEESLSNTSELARLLGRDEAHAQRFISSLSVNRTEFFRDPDAFRHLEAVFGDYLRASSRPGEELRAWSAGCASGEEAYSLAILLTEIADRLGRGHDFRVFATDVSGAAIEHASLGEYDEGALRGLSPDRRDRFFEPVGGRYRVTEDLRRHLVFARHDLHRDPPFGNLHLVTCRNVLIYFRKEWQRRVLSTLHFSLRAGGVLFLGDSESVADQSLYFEPAGAKVHRVYRRRVGRTDLLPVSPPQRARSAPVRQRVSAVDDARDMLFAAYVPATAVVNAAGEVEHLIGDVADYLSLPTGRMTPRIDRLARGGLGTAVSAALARCQRTGELAEHPAVSLPGTERSVRVMVRPIAGVERYLVTFASAPTSASGAENASSLDLAHVHDELLSTRESLEATIEELQAANEELQASNEEMHASNEELQATNEELHATNEELHVLTAERNERIHELDRLTDDVFNLLNATGVATLFLDEQLCIRRLIGPVGAYLRLLDVDVGRPLSHFRDGLVGLDLLALASNVLEQQEPFESHGAQVNGMRVLVRALPYASASGRDRGVVLGFVDVTDLKETQERLRGVLDSLPQHVALVDEAGRLAMVNDSWRRFAESQGGSVQLGADYLAIAAADPSASGIAKGIEDVLAGDRGHFSAVYPCATPDRELRFRMDASPLIAGEPGRVVGAVVSHMNTTLLHEAEQSTQEAMVAFRRVFESSTASLLVVDTETLIVSDINAAACALLRRSSEAVVGSSMEMLVPSGRSEVWRSTLQGLPPDGEVLRMLEVLDGDGFDRAMNVVLRSLYSEQQRFALVELRVASGAVAEASAGADGAVSTRRLEALGKLAGGVAHETNNVLAGIVAVVEPWIESEQVDPELRGELQDVLAACRRGKDVTQQLLGFARADTVVRPTDVGAVVREIATSLRAMAAEGVRIEVSTAPELVVLGDRTLLAQALLNLGINGLDAIGQRGLLEIRVSEVSVDGGLAALIEVRDDGHGMEASVAARAFEPFYTTKPRGEGTGLGLPMVYGTVRSMNGVIEIQSVVSEGTTIAITLPLTEAPEKAPETPRERPTLHGRALVIDDDRLVRRGIARMLKRCGMDVLTAEGGEEGLSLLDSHRLDLVVLDVVMPDIDGWETLRRIRSRQPTLPVLMCSGYAENTRGVQAERGPETGFVYKPVGADELAKAAQALMTSRS